MTATSYYQPPDPPPDDCKWHTWEFDPDALPLVESCPECEAEREEYEDGAYDRWKDDQMTKEQDEPDYYDDRD